MSIVVDDKALYVHGREIRWDAIRAIATYKRDLFIHDDICLAFQTEGDLWVEISEEQPGFELLIAEVERRFASVPEDWFTAVMHPAFETNYRVLWRINGLDEEKRRSI